jgi:hypothetical protein
MNTRYLRLLIAAIGLMIQGSAGCGSNGPHMVPIRGEVTYQGLPLINVTQGIVRYSPKAPGTPAREATGRIQPDGSFVMTTFKNADGVVAGEYNITVSAYSSPVLSREQTESGVHAAMPKLMIPEKYLQPDASGLTDTVDSEHSGFKRLEITNGEPGLGGTARQ